MQCDKALRFYSMLSNCEAHRMNRSKIPLVDCDEETGSAVSGQLREVLLEPSTVSRSNDATVAGLSSVQIQAMTNGDFIEIIRSVDYPFAGKERLEYFDRDTLQRVVYLVRRWCQRRSSHAESVIGTRDSHDGRLAS